MYVLPLQSNKPNNKMTLWRKNYFLPQLQKLWRRKISKDVKSTYFAFSNNDPNEIYLVLSDTFSKLVDRHAPLKKKVQRGNHNPFISKEMRKVIYTRGRLRNNFCKSHSEVSERKYKRQRNLCVSLRRKTIIF